MAGAATIDKLTNALTLVIKTMFQLLDERQRRLLVACAAKGYGYGGIKLLHEMSGLNERTINSGIEELENSSSLTESTRIRKAGAGRKSLKEIQPELLLCVKKILENNAYGEPPSVISWTNLSLREISSILKEEFGIAAGKDVVSRLLEELGYSRQQNQKTLQAGTPQPDREVQFKYINQKAQEFIDSNYPVISIDTKKKELLGNFKNNGAEYRPAKRPREVFDHDFEIPDPGKIAPHGVYLINSNTGFVNLGTEHETSAFAVESIRRWWNIVGKETFPNARRLYINCDGCGGNGLRQRLWKFELAMFAQETGLEIHVSHFPTGTSKWNKVEHRLFCFITKNWAGMPLIDINTTVNLISSTKTKKELEVKCVIDTNKYPAWLNDDDESMCKIDIEAIGPYESWNYVIRGFKKYS